MNYDREYALDYIRVLSTLMIFVFHFNQQLGFHKISSDILLVQRFLNDSIGSIGISLFIILSGAAIYTAYHTRRSITFIDFMKKRVKSILPQFYIAYIVIFILLTLYYGAIPRQENLSTFVLTLMGLDGFFYYLIPNFYLVGEWFLGFILILYLVVPFVLKTDLLKAFVISIIVAIVVVENYSMVSSMDILHFPLVRLPEFIFGMVVMHYRDKLLTPFMLISVAVLFFYCYFVELTYLKSNFHYMYTRILVGMVTFVFLFMLFNYLAKISRKVNLIILKLSSVSFLFFLLHHNMIAMFFTPCDGGKLPNYYFVWIIATILLMSWILQYFEKRIIHDRFFKSKKT